VHSSGLHGVEAFPGSAIQLQWLAEGIPPNPEDRAIALVHVLNPYGMAWLRRFNEHNVDLNRNFLGLDEKFEGAPEGYAHLNEFLNPLVPPSSAGFYLQAAVLLARQGMAALKEAVAAGQYEYPKGLFFGGARLEQGPAKLHDYMVARLKAVERIVAIDVHTGLGTFGDDRLLVRTMASAMAAAFGNRLQPLGTSGVAYQTRGDQENMYQRLCSGAEVYFATQEFGTYHPVKVLKALRAENQWHNYGDRAVDHPAKTRLRAVFSPEAPSWRTYVLRRGHEVISQAQTLAFG